jgi:hypothetical protein
MKPVSNIPDLEKWRDTSMPMFYSDASYGLNGRFRIPFRSYIFTVVVSNGGDWDHVSVSLPNRCPNWEEMCFFKDLFWDESETVVQYHPAKAEFVNCHPYCLHLWRPQKADLPKPPSIFVGIKR